MLSKKSSKRPRKYIPFSVPSIAREEIKEVADTLKSGWLSTGPRTQKFEEDFAYYTGAKYAVGLTSCTAALHMALLAHGVGRGDEVIMPSFTFASCANMAINVGARPIFVDIKADSFNIDPESIKKNITSKTKAIIPVHYGGQACDIEEIKKIAKDSNNIVVIEDAAHALGGEYRGKRIGSSGNTTCFSFYPTKSISTGEGGMLTTNNKRIADFVRINRLHGMSKDGWKRYSRKGSWKYEIKSAGWKYNMFDIQAALGIQQLKKLDGFIETRNKYAKMYNDGLADIRGIVTPYESLDTLHARHLYPILLEEFDRDTFIELLAKKNIGTSVHFIPLHTQPLYKNKFGYRRGDFPVTERVFKSIVSLPLFPKMTQGDIKYVISSIREILHG